MSSELTSEYPTLISKTSLDVLKSNNKKRRDILKPIKALSVWAFILGFGFEQNLLWFYSLGRF